MIGNFREFEAEDGLILKYIEYRIDNPKASLIHIHGIAGSPIRDLGEFGDFLNERGINFYRLYLRGFPPSSGKRGDIDSFETFYKDIATFMDIVVDMDKTNLFISGRSLGGAIAAHFVAGGYRDVKGVILINPAYKTGGRFRFPIYKTLLVLIGNLIAPHRVMINTYRDPSYITHPLDREEAEERHDDPFVVYVYSPRFLMEAYKASKSMPKIAKKACKPLLLIYGDKDETVDPSGNVEIFEKWCHEDKETYIVEGGGHGIHVIYHSKEKIASWILERSK